MKFADVEQQLDLASSDRERERILKKSLDKVHGPDARTALICLANVCKRLKKFKRAAELYRLVGMNEDAEKARARA